MPDVISETIPPVDRRELLAAALNALTAHVVIVDHDGRILAVNDAWLAFAAENGAAADASVGVGAQYCPPAGYDEAGGDACEGLRRVLAGEVAEFRHEYPCHSPSERRWFEMRATPLNAAGGGAVIVLRPSPSANLPSSSLRSWPITTSSPG